MSKSARWNDLGIAYLAWIDLLKEHVMPQNAALLAFTIYELLEENHQSGKAVIKRPCTVHGVGLGSE